MPQVLLPDGLKITETSACSVLFPDKEPQEDLIQIKLCQTNPQKLYGADGRAWLGPNGAEATAGINAEAAYLYDGKLRGVR